MIQLQIAGVLHDAEGEFSSGFGVEKRTAIEGSGAIHGYSAKPQPAFIEGAIIDRGTLDVKALLLLDGVTVTLKCGNGKVQILRDAWQCGDGKVSSDNGKIEVRFESSSELEETA